VNVKRAPLDSRNIHKIPPRNDSYLARAAIASSTARLIARASRSAPIFPTSRRRHADPAEPASEGYEPALEHAPRKPYSAFDSVAFLAGERWSTIRAALAAVAALPALNFITLGGSVWHAFGASTIFTQTVVLERTAPARRKLVYKIVRARPDLLQRAGKIFARLQCSRGFQLFLSSGPCDASASASLFRRVAG
jgi:hypothetical protein